MTILSPTKVIVLLIFGLSFAVAGVTQDCADPQLLCGQSAAETLSTESGVDADIPPSFCFNSAPNAVFFEFQTLDLNQFPSLSYADSTAVVSISNISCLQDSTYGNQIGIAIFSATDPCNGSTMNALECQIMSQAQEFSLSNLEPSTTYYIMVTGIPGTLPAINPSECNVSISVSGPAVTYDLEADWNVGENDESQFLLTGQTLVLNANPALSGYSWNGTALNETTGETVTANPTEEGQEEYIVETTINNCIYTDEVTVQILPAIVPYNAFTPNGDGINDTWEIRNINQWRNAQINVYSRWGTRVFQATNYNNDWNGENLPAATYYYTIELNPIDFNAEPITGSVTILR